MVAVERDGTPRVPSEASMMEYVLVMATGDAESRPKGGWVEYHNGPQAKPGLNGMKKGELLGEKKAFGYLSHGNAAFRFGVRSFSLSLSSRSRCVRSVASALASD
jgi:hypothetical protein